MSRVTRCIPTLALALAVALPGTARATQLLRPLFPNGFVRATQPASGPYPSMTLVGTLGQTITGGAVHSGSGRTICHGYWCVGQYAVTGVPEDDPIAEPDLPKILALSGPWPNPGRGRISFSLELPEDATVHLSVLDVAGRLVSSLPDHTLPAGRHAISWNAVGEGVAAGLYFARLEVGGRPVGTRRVVLIR